MSATKRKRWLTTFILVAALIALAILQLRWFPAWAAAFLMPVAFAPVWWGREPN